MMIANHPRRFTPGTAWLLVAMMVLGACSGASSGDTPGTSDSPGPGTPGGTGNSSSPDDPDDPAEPATPDSAIDFDQFDLTFDDLFYSPYQIAAPFTKLAYTISSPNMKVTDAVHPV